MSGHTPGPWAVEPEDLSPEGGYWITGRASDGAHVTICGRGEWPNRAAMSTANAHLIAAAPDLLAAVKAALNWPDEDEYGNQMEEQFGTPAYRAFRQQLRAAIAKAEPSK